MEYPVSVLCWAGFFIFRDKSTTGKKNLLTPNLLEAEMKKQTATSIEIDRLLDEIRAEEDAVPLSPWTLTLQEMMNWDKEELDWDKGKRNYGLTELCDADTPQKLNEASLGHVYWHYIESKSNSFSIISNYSKIEIKHNKPKVKYLIHELNRDNYLDLWGHYQKDGPTGIHVVEPYFFVIGISLNKIRELLEQYEQYSILYSGPEKGGNVINYKNIGPEEDIGLFHPTKIAQFYSKIIGRPLVLEARISGWIGGYGALKHGIKEVAGIRKSRKWISKAVRNY